MALIICPECKREVSSKVRICPHCGYPFSQEELAFGQSPIYQQVPDEHSNRDQIVKTLPSQRKKYVKLMILVALLILVMAAVSFFWIMPSIQYNKGLKDIYNEDYEAALGIADLLPKESAGLLRQELSNYCLEKAKVLVEQKQYQKAIDISENCTEVDQQVVKDAINLSIIADLKLFWEQDTLKCYDIHLSLLEIPLETIATQSELAEYVRKSEKYVTLGNEIEVLFLHANPISADYMPPDLEDVFSSYMKVIISLREEYRALPRLGFMTENQANIIFNEFSHSWDEFNNELKRLQ